ncbi:MAG: hypothetical protein EB079_00150 [Verrucomicrobia bacterium]|nr:hypothetical protein [Verrucomicrobiota bacterium]
MNKHIFQLLRCKDYIFCMELLIFYHSNRMLFLFHSEMILIKSLMVFLLHHQASKILISYIY